MKKFLVIILLLAGTTTLFSQRIIVFNDSTAPSQQLRYQEDKNIASWNFSLLMRGAFTLEYERRFNDYFLGLVGAGVTFYDPYTFMFIPIVMGNGPIKYKHNAGFMADAGLKFFPRMMDGLDGFFIAPFVRFRNYNYDETLDNVLYRQSRYMTDYTFVVGWQYESWGDVIWSCYFGAGLSRESTPVYDSDTKTVSNMMFSAPILVVGLTIGYPF